MLFARRLLASKSSLPAASDGRPTLAQWIEQYHLAEREKRGRITASSPLVGKRVDELSLPSAGVNLLAIERGKGLAARVLRPTAPLELQADDVLLADVQAENHGLNVAWNSLQLEPLPFNEIGNYFVDRSQDIGAVEVILPAESRLIGQTVREARISPEYGLTVIGLRHGSKVAVHDLLDERLKIGDTLLLIGFWPEIRELQSKKDDVVVLNMPAELEEVLPAARRAPQALAVLGLVVALMISGLVPNVQAALIGCLLMGLFGCVDFNSAYRSINWKSLILIVGMLPFSLALQRTGGVDLAADDALLGLLGRRGAASGVGERLFVITAALQVCSLIQYGHSRIDGACGAGNRQRPRRVAVSVRDDRRPGRVDRVRHAGFVAGEHAGRGSRTIQFWRFRQGGCAVQHRGCDRQCDAGSDLSSILNRILPETNPAAGRERLITTP